MITQSFSSAEPLAELPAICDAFEDILFPSLCSLDSFFILAKEDGIIEDLDVAEGGGGFTAVVDDGGSGTAEVTRVCVDAVETER